MSPAAGIASTPSAWHGLRTIFFFFEFQKLGLTLIYIYIYICLFSFPLTQSPPCLPLKNTQVDIPASQLSGFSCSSPVVRHTYLYKLLRTAFANIPQRDPSGVSTKVAIDASGLMKVTHMLHVAAAGLDGAAGMASHPLASMGTQQTAATVQRVGVAQFVLLPVEQRGKSEGQEGGPEDIEGWGV